MKLRWALAVSIVGFFLITGVGFLISPGSPLSGELVMIQFGAHCTTVQMQEIDNFWHH